MDERAMDAAMNPREERHRDEYGRQSLARGRSPITVKKDKTESEIMAHMRGLNSISERNAGIARAL